MARGRLFVVAGPSGAGKTTVIARALQSVPMHLSISATTRAPRDGEVDGADYLFVTEERFDRLVESGALLEWEQVYGHRYGTPRAVVEEALERGEDVLLEIDVKGALSVREQVPDSVLIFIEPPSPEALEARLEGRETDDRSAIERRLEVAPWELEMGRTRFEHTIVNDDLEQAVAELVRLLRGDTF